MELLGRYKNGNFKTTILSDGTKIRETEDDEFIPAFAIWDVHSAMKVVQQMENLEIF